MVDERALTRREQEQAVIEAACHCVDEAFGTWEATDELTAAVKRYRMPATEQTLERRERERAERRALRIALMHHLVDLHQRSNRPCPTCERSREALGGIRLGCTVPFGGQFDILKGALDDESKR